MMRPSLDFSKINAAALPALPALCARWMPGGKRIGRMVSSFVAGIGGFLRDLRPFMMAPISMGSGFRQTFDQQSSCDGS